MADGKANIAARDFTARQRAAIRRSILAWYRRNARKLPWRASSEPYRIWLSEILLQQTRVDTVIPYYKRFIRAYPTVETLAAASSDDVLKLWEGLGYYTRARNLHRTARKVATELGGRFPDSLEALQRLPGVGRYTAGAVASIAFGRRAPVLDGNVKRVLARLTAMGECIDDGPAIERLWYLAETLLPRHDAGDFNQALMELGARVCTPKSPRCAHCPLRRRCVAAARGVQDSLPIRRAKRPIPHIEAVAAAIRKKGRYLVVKRPLRGLLGGLWELPGGPIRRMETHAEALRRRIRETLDISVSVGKGLGVVSHAFSHRTLRVHVYRCNHRAGRPTPRTHAELSWVPPSRLDALAFGTLGRKLLERL